MYTTQKYNTTTNNKVIKFIESHFNFFYILMLIMLMFNVFYKINTLNISFDESRHGISAYEMINQNQYIVNTFQYKNDYWNLKPIFSFLPVILGFKLAGFNMIGLRLFSCISALLTIIIITLFVKHKHGKLASLISFAVLSTNLQYIVYHCARGAEADAVYILFFTLSVLCMLYSKERTYFLYLSSFFCSLAFLTKSFHVLSLVAILALYIFLSGNFRKFKLLQWILTIFYFALPILLWGTLRFSQDGFYFFENMISYDLLNRSSNSIEGHTGGIFYYFLTIIRYHGIWLILLVPSSVYYIYQNFNKIIKSKYILLITLWIVVPFALYTVAKTKIEWYILPIYPAMAICCGALFSKLLKQTSLHKIVYVLFTLVFLFITFSYQVSILHILQNFNNDPYQASIKQIGNLQVYNGFNLYKTETCLSDNGIWSQTDIFSAELYGNFHAKNGGFRAFFSDTTSKAVIIAPEDSNTLHYINQHSLKIAAKTDHYLLIKK